MPTCSPYGTGRKNGGIVSTNMVSLRDRLNHRPRINALARRGCVLVDATPPKCQRPYLVRDDMSADTTYIQSHTHPARTTFHQPASHANAMPQRGQMSVENAHPKITHVP